MRKVPSPPYGGVDKDYQLSRFLSEINESDQNSEDALRSVSIRSFGAKVDGITDDTAAIQAAVDSGEPIITCPAGDIALAGTVEIDAGIQFIGAGSCGAASGSIATIGPGTTRFLYSGTGWAFKLVGSGSEGKQNIHLSHFMITGNADATGGIWVGSDATGFVLLSSLKHILVRDFTNTDAKGVYWAQSQQCIAEHVYTVHNYDNVVIGNTDSVTTTLTELACTYEQATRYGKYIRSAGNCVELMCVAQSNDSDGRHIQPNGVGAAVSNYTMYSPHSEDNCRSLGTAPLYIGNNGGTEPTNIGIRGPCYWDDVTTKTQCGNVRSIDLDACNSLHFEDMPLQSYAFGFIRCTSSTTDGLFVPKGRGWGIQESNISGNHANGIRVGGKSNGYAATITSGSTVDFPYQDGIVDITDTTSNKSARISMNGSGHTTTIHSDPDSGFSVAAHAADNRIHLFWNGGTSKYRISNGYGVDHAVKATVIMAG